MTETPDYGLLNDQEDARFGARRFGRFGTVAKNGCGMIALYNIERAANEETRFEPFYEARKPIKTNFFGLLGTRPSTISKNLKRKGFTVERIRKKKAGEAPLYDGVIVLYWHFFGAHYVAGIGKGDGTYMLTFSSICANTSSIRIVSGAFAFRKRMTNNGTKKQAAASLPALLFTGSESGTVHRIVKIVERFDHENAQDQDDPGRQRNAYRDHRSIVAAEPDHGAVDGDKDGSERADRNG